MAVIGNNNEQGAYPLISFQVSQTWACPVAMEAIVYVIGAGGSGAALGPLYYVLRNATGGGGGGCVVSRLKLSAQNYTVTIGSGGDDGGTSGVTNGAAGGSSEFSGTGITTMTAGGGAAGAQDTSALTGSAGGSASGGNIMNNVGGVSGTNTADTQQVSGGGGVNLYGSGAVGATSSSVAAGGTPHGVSIEGGIDYSNVATQGYRKRNQGISLSYFPFNITHTSGYYQTANPGEDGMNPYTIHSGFQLGNAESVTDSANARTMVSGPFCGGQGTRGSTRNSSIHAQNGGVGGGGGAAQSTSHSSYSSGTANPGAGGSGLILIFPTQLG